MIRKKILHHKSFKGSDKDFINNSFSRTLRTSDIEKKYEFRKDRSTLHWGQRKLLLSEIEFLTKYGHLSDKVLYAGSAPGTHIKSLASLFPNKHFILYDPRDFNVKESKGDDKYASIEIHKQYFYNEDAKKYTKDKLLFISDIRVSPEESIVYKDMKMQEDWVKIIKPAASMLKFRPPWCISIYKGKKDTPKERKKYKLKYLKGDIYLPIWGPVTTTEARLITVGDIEYKEYDSCKYEYQLFYFNTYTRLKYHKRPFNLKIDKIPGLCHCYDCTSEIYVLAEYFKKIHNINNKEDLEYAVKETVKKINKILTYGKINLLDYYKRFYNKSRQKKRKN